MLCDSLSNATQGCAVDTNGILLETDKDTHIKQLCDYEDTNQEETVLKQPPISTNNHSDTPIKQRWNSQSTGLMVQEETRLTALPSMQLQSPSYQENLANSHHDNLEISSTEPLQPDVDPETSGIELLYNNDNPEADAESFVHCHESHHAISPANTFFTELSLHEDQSDPPGIRDMIGTLNVRNPHNMVARNQYASESISLDNGAYSGPSFSMPSSAGVRHSTNNEEELENVQAQQQNPGEALPFNDPYDTEERMLHARVYT